MSQLLHIDAEYKQWIQALSLRYRRSRIKASIRMNSGYMKRWYLFYYQEDTKLHQLGAEIENTKLHQVAAEILHQRGGEKLQQPVEEF